MKATNESDSDMYEFKQQCLIPGLYYEHLLKWFQSFSSRSIFIIDYDSFKTQSSVYMNNLQIFMGLKKKVNYKDLLFYDENESILKFTQFNSFNLTAKLIVGNKKIADDSQRFLENYYKDSNSNLKLFLIKHAYNVPEWLQIF